MAEIAYTNIEDGTEITANIFNERFGQILAVINGGLDNENFADGGIPASALATGVFEKIRPVGSLYFNATDITDPATLLGYGTWIMYASGRVPVGYDATDTDFNAAEKEGGEKEHTLTGAESGEKGHNHTQNPHKHTYNLSPNFNVGPGVNTAMDIASTANQAKDTSTTTATNIAIAASSASSAHNNLSPFITVYIWKRTA